MKLLSINVGLPREIEWHGKVVRTSIFKAAVPGRIRVAKLNLEGDQQSDLTVHGGVDKAVYVYPSEHYRFWREELPGIFAEPILKRSPIKTALSSSPPSVVKFSPNAPHGRSSLW